MHTKAYCIIHLLFYTSYSAGMPCIGFAFTICKLSTQINRYQTKVILLYSCKDLSCKTHIKCGHMSIASQLPLYYLPCNQQLSILHIIHFFFPVTLTSQRYFAISQAHDMLNTFRVQMAPPWPPLPSRSFVPFPNEAPGAPGNFRMLLEATSTSS